MESSLYLQRTELTCDSDELPPLRTRFLALALTVALALACIFSPIAVAHEMHHDCTGVGCVTCAEMAGNLSLAQRGSVPHNPIAIVSLLIIYAIAIIGVEHASYAPVTLVSLKVRLDD